jgi:type III pantothenate kinase
LAKYFNTELLVAGVGKAEYGIDVDVDAPKSLGADRAVNAIGAHEKFEGDLIVVDFGTATTIDHIDARGL